MTTTTSIHVFQTELTSLETELRQLEMMLTAKRQQLGFFQNLQTQADECLETLSRVVNHVKESTAHGAICASRQRFAIASLKSAVLTLFAGSDGGNDSGGNEPTDPTPDDPTPGADDDELDLIAFNGETGNYLLSNGSTSVEDCPESSLVGQQYQFTSPFASLLWEDAPLTGQHCSVSFEDENNGNKGSQSGEAMPFVQLIKVSDGVAYQRKCDGEILCCYFGFRTKAIAQSWLHFFEATTSSLELRLAKRLEGFRWEIKAKGISIKQIERYAKECDFTSSYRTEVSSAMPPSYKKPEPPQPVNPEQLQPGDIVTPLLTPGDSYEVLQIMPNGILDCKSLRAGAQMGLRLTAVSLVQKGQAVAATDIDLDF